MENSNNQNSNLVPLVVVLIFIVLCLGGFIVYDKFMNNDSKEQKEKTDVLKEENIGLNSDLAIKLQDMIESPYFIAKPKTTSSYTNEEKMIISIFNTLDKATRQTIDRDGIPVSIYKLASSYVEEEYNNIFGDSSYKDQTVTIDQETFLGVFEKATYDSETKTYTISALSGGLNLSGASVMKNISSIIDYKDRVEVKANYLFVNYTLTDKKEATVYNFSNDDYPFALYMKTEGKTQIASVNQADNKEYFDDNSNLNDEYFINKYSTKINTYTYTFKKNDLNQYYLYGVKLTKAN